MIHSLLLQVTTDAADAAETVQEIPVLELLMEGGIFMYILLALSIIAIYIFIERYFVIVSASKVDRDFMTRIREHMLNGNIRAAADLCQQTDTPTSRMVEKGIRRIGKPLRNIEVAIENVGKLELLRLEKRLAGLATIAGAAPMIGFLGTVVGMIRAFFQISTASNNVDPGALAGGIYQALVTTAAGLAIGIVAFIGYNVLVAMVQKVIYKMEATTIEFVDLLQEPAK